MRRSVLIYLSVHIFGASRQITIHITILLSVIGHQIRGHWRVSMSPDYFGFVNNIDLRYILINVHSISYYFLAATSKL